MVFAAEQLAPFLSEGLRDWITVIGAGIGVIGLVGTIWGLVYAIRQIKQTKKAAHAAKEAADRAFNESQKSFHRYTAANAHRLIHEVKIHIKNGAWALASARLSDLANQLAQMGSEGEGWAELVLELRQWEVTCERRSVTKAQFAITKWHEFSLKLQAKMDNHYGPFLPTITKEDDDDSRRQVNGADQSIITKDYPEGNQMEK
jgi:hypothetical protein